MVDIAVFLARSLEIVKQTGGARDRIVVDQSIVFGRTSAQSFEVVTKLAQSVGFELRLLVGAPRKRFVDSLSLLRPERRIGGSLAAAAVGAAVPRIHETVQAVTIDQAIREAQCANRGDFRRRRALYKVVATFERENGRPIAGLCSDVGDARAVLDEAVNRFCDRGVVKVVARPYGDPTPPSPCRLKLALAGTAPSSGPTPP